MPRSGVGVYTLPALNPVVPATTITSAWGNNTLNDIATALTQSISSAGVTTPTANLPMGGFKHTGVAVAAAFDQYASAGQVQESALLLLTGVANSVVSGSTAYTANLSFGQPGSRALAANQMIILVPNGDAVGAAPTLSVNGDTARAITSTGGSAAIFLKSGQPVILTWSGSAWVLADSAPTYGAEWIQETNPVTWVNATQVKFTGVNLTARYIVGTRVAFKDNAVQKYAYVSVSAFGADTTLTLVLDDASAMVGATTVFQYSVYNANHLSAPAMSSVLIESAAVGSLGTGAVKVQFSTKLLDKLGEFDAVTNYRFTATYTGWYDVWAELVMNNTVSTGIQGYLQINKNGVLFQSTQAGNITANTGLGACFNTIRKIMTLVAGDYIEIFASYSGGASNNTYSSGGDLIINRIA